MIARFGRIRLDSTWGHGVRLDEALTLSIQYFQQLSLHQHLSVVVDILTTHERRDLNHFSAHICSKQI